MGMSPEPARNLDAALKKTAEAAAAGARIICLPELYRTQYFCQREDYACFDLAEPVPGPTTKLFAKLAARLRVVVIVPLFERRTIGLYHNTAVVIDADGSLAGVYRKMHIPDDPGYYEKFYFAPGDLGFHAMDTKVDRIGVLICWDQWFPEAARLVALAGANVIFYPTAIGWQDHEKDLYGARQHDAWLVAQRGHAIANGVHVAAVNRVGREKPSADSPGIEFWGASFVCDPQGVMLAQAPVDHEAILYADINHADIEDVRRRWPFFRDRRVDAYGAINRRFAE